MQERQAQRAKPRTRRKFFEKFKRNAVEAVEILSPWRFDRRDRCRPTPL